MGSSPDDPAQGTPPDEPSDPAAQPRGPDDEERRDPDARANPGRDRASRAISRRRLLAEGAALFATGVVVGGGAVLAASALRQSGVVVTPTSPGGVVPTPEGASPEPIESSPPEGPDRVKRENVRRGTTAWELPLRGRGDAQGYAGDVSMAPGDPLTLHVSSSLPTVSITLYRLGWYGGKGARVVARWPRLALGAQPPPTTDPQTGMIRAPWAAAVNDTVSGGWVSGIYVAVLSPIGGEPQYVSFVVREPRPTAPILFVSSTTTHQAYNPWGGKSLYPDESSGAKTVSGDVNAVIVSWDRPYQDLRGAGLVLRWEYPFVRWMESRGYDVAYAADLDLERHPELLDGRRLVLLVGHPEYWSVAMRRTLEAAIARGTNVASFAANELYWRVRFELGDGGQYRTVTCYRKAEIDPIAPTDPAQATTKWRDQPAPAAESKVIGQMYGHMVLSPGDFVCAAPDHWVYAGTGMRAGDGIANLVGQEYDRFWPDPQLAPPGTLLLASSPVRPNLGHEVSIYGPAPANEPWPPKHNATIYTASSGATVFSAGTMQWSWALDDWGNPDFEGVTTPVDGRVGTMTANILDRLGR